MSLDQNMIDAFSIAIEQEVEMNPLARSTYTEAILAAVEGLDPADRQEQIVRVAADLCFAFSGVVQDTAIAEAEARQKREADEEAQREARRAERRERQRREEEEYAREEEEYARQQERVREEREANNPYAGQEPACGFPSCRIPECYDGTYSNAIANSVERAVARQSQFYADNFVVSNNWNTPWRDFGYTYSVPTVDQGGTLAEWERLLLGNNLFTAPMGPPAPEVDPVLGTQGL